MNHYEWSKIKFYHQSCYSWPVHHSRSSASLSSKCLVAAINGAPRAGWHTTAHQVPPCSWTDLDIIPKKLLSKPGKVGLVPKNILQQRNFMPLFLTNPQAAKPSPQRVFSTARLQRHAMSAVSLSVWAGRIEFWKAFCGWKNAIQLTQ